MKNVTITEIAGGDDVTFDQTIESDSVTALGGGIAVNGDVDDSALNSGVNTGIMAGDDVTLDDSIVGNGNTQLNDSTVGAFAGRGPATNITGENVNTGSGDLLDVDAGGDAQVVTGHGNDVRGAVDVDLQNVDGPINLAVGDENRQTALEDNSTTFEDSFNTDNSVEDSFNTSIDDSFNRVIEDNDTHVVEVDDSFNSLVEDNDTTSFELSESYEDNSHYSDDDSWTSRFELDHDHVDIWGDRNDVDLDA
jgi:hypothetical protein